jgi:hypothetical protein
MVKGGGEDESHGRGGCRCARVPLTTAVLGKATYSYGSKDGALAEPNRDSIFVLYSPVRMPAG